MVAIWKKTILFFAAALALSLAACGGSSITTGYDAPTISGAQTIDSTPEQAASFLGADGGLGSLLLYEGSTSFTWVEESNLELYDQYTKAWEDAGWELATSFDTGADLWQKDDWSALSLFFMGLNNQQRTALAQAGMEPPPLGATMMMARIWNTSKPITADAAEALGWTSYTSDDYNVTFLVPPRAVIEDTNPAVRGVGINGDFGGAVLGDAAFVASSLNVNIETDDPKQAIITVLSSQPDVQYSAADIEEFTTEAGDPAAQLRVQIQDQTAYFAAVRLGGRILMLAGNGTGFDNPAAWQMMVQPAFEMIVRSMHE
jgi:hypothetical protein